MAVRKKGRAPAAKAKAAATETETVESTLMPQATAKLTVSVKRRLSTGDEIFIAPGIEMGCAPDDLDETQASVTERVNAWMDELLEAYPDSDPIEDEDELEDEDADEDEAEDEDEDGEEEDWPTEAEIKKMKKAELLALAEEAEVELEGTTVKELREELIDLLHGEEEDEDEDELEDEDADEDEDEDEAEEGDDELYTEEELDDLKLEELQEIVDAWELKHPRFKKGASVKIKKAKYVAFILEAQEEE